MMLQGSKLLPVVILSEAKDLCNLPAAHPLRTSDIG